jgi:hypothetical protein
MCDIDMWIGGVVRRCDADAAPLVVVVDVDVAVDVAVD